MDQYDYGRMKEWVLKSCKADIVRIYDEAFSDHWNRYMKDTNGQILAESFALPLIISWLLWYIFQEYPITGILGVSILAIMLCAFAHYVFSMRHHRSWAHDQFIGYYTEQATKRCLLECRVAMGATVTDEAEQKDIAAFFEIAARDDDIGAAMYRVWAHNSTKAL